MGEIPPWPELPHVMLFSFPKVHWSLTLTSRPIKQQLTHHLCAAPTGAGVGGPTVSRYPGHHAGPRVFSCESGGVMRSTHRLLTSASIQATRTPAGQLVRSRLHRRFGACSIPQQFPGLRCVFKSYLCAGFPNSSGGAVTDSSGVLVGLHLGNVYHKVPTPARGRGRRVIQDTMELDAADLRPEATSALPTTEAAAREAYNNSGM
jgi:hypothetical protein